MAYKIKRSKGYKQKLKYFVDEELSDKNLKNYDDWSISYQPKKKGYRAREVIITLKPKKNKK
jgi:hypothetical protein